ncbi:MAG TPA: penicillin-binding protein 2 [Cyclobacteriaceae bacterium]|nr:penicillin-binding protein 2 [Cyclobacteriaceae bacterium]MCB9238095.1 penicillin-binding protein 2 [Flammeovirgaceae bacterium]MCB0499515.1 penicillin-binding protein 2 [Cyclobacteriaceae bacterium]MCO5272513.1 penicillin-binding protein 2 [Cyclobacteriaceae bacterium]MCW5901581.1 penicillin-binding protein 2 [Cyclobacteriaceae bacterium]
MNEGRKEILQIIFILTGLVFLVKLFSIQVLDNRYAELADSNAILKEVEYPFRGLIYDRNHKLIVYNTPEFDINVIQKDIKGFDSAKFCRVFQMSRGELRKRFKEMKARKEYSPYKPTLFIDRLSNEEFARVQDHLDEFPGLYVQARTTRSYTTPALANALGYVSEVSKGQLERDKSGIYKQGDYIGQSGIESFYEEQLRGKRGVKFKLRNVRGIEKGSFKEGAYDTLSIPGMDLVSSIDIDLQQYGERLMKGKSGSIVAIEPATGEILSLVSGPSYDPNLLTGRNYSSNFVLISNDTLKPLFTRPLMAQYRPGSIFKIAQAMTALQEGVITPETRIYCDRSIIACHGDHTYEDLRGAIANSCNPYFHGVLRRMLNKGISNDPYEDTRIGLEEWNRHIRSFGFGEPLGVDLPNEKGGLIPTPAYYDKAYNNRPWKFSNIYSLAIGEGENLVVPLQMANFAAIVANRGFYYTPHLVKAIGNDGPLPQYREKKFTTIDSAYFNVAVDAMQRVVESGTGQYRAKLQDIIVCGKTGTVQNDPLPAHSVFIAFAPRDNPKIAVSVYVEDAGQGARAAASIASLMIEKYLLGGTKRPYIEQYVLNGQFLY